MSNTHHLELESYRYILFGNDLEYSADLSRDRVYGFNSVDSCIRRAREVRQNYMMIVDRYAPQSPIFLNKENDFNPQEQE